MLLVQIVVQRKLESFGCVLNRLHCKQAVLLTHCDCALEDAWISVIVFVSCILNQVSN